MKELNSKKNRGKKKYTITLLVDNPDSWILPWVENLKNILAESHEVSLTYDAKEIRKGDFSFFLGCTKIVPGEYLKRNKLNLVVHESDLPFGKGWSPVAWQVLKGVSTIPVVLFEATEDLDSGPIYLRDTMVLNGTELLPEIREKQGEKTLQMVLEFLKKWPELNPVEQQGDSVVFRRRTEQDDKLDTNKTIEEHFDQLRIVHNEKYPAWFEFGGRKYKIKIYRCD